VSLTTTISYDERSVWVLDEARAISLKYLIEVVEERIRRGVVANTRDSGVCVSPWVAPSGVIAEQSPTVPLVSLT